MVNSPLIRPAIYWGKPLPPPTAATGDVKGKGIGKTKNVDLGLGHEAKAEIDGIPLEEEYLNI